ncbi:MAG: lysophospholipid acyltransferase family protein [Acidobacteriota bacterium]|jgi:1-acyl-sn-glycerol-3-phosphate acyltransferase
MLAAILLFSTWTVLGIPGAVIGIPWTLATRNVALLHWLGVSITRAGLWVAGIRMQVVWEQPPVRGQQYIFLPNHISNLDPPILYPLLPGHTAVFLKRSLMRIPVLGYAMGLAKFIPVDRDRRVESAMESVAAARSVLAAGIHVLSFVEGTRSRDGRLQAFKKGPFYLSMESGAPVVPISIYGTETMMKKGSLKIFPGTAHVTFHAPLFPGDFASREELMRAAREAIAAGLPEWMRGPAATA